MFEQKCWETKGASHAGNWRKSSWDRGKGEYKSCEKRVGLEDRKQRERDAGHEAYFILSVMGSHERLLFVMGVTSMQEREWESAAIAQSRWEMMGTYTRVAAEATAQSPLDLKLLDREELGDLTSFGLSHQVN